VPSAGYTQIPPMGVNDARQIVGQVTQPTAGHSPVPVPDGEFEISADAGRIVQLRVTDINNQGLIVGTSESQPWWGNKDRPV